MGATPLLELYGFAAEVHRVLAERKVSVARTLVGNYVTSLDMAGCLGDDLPGRRGAAAAVGRAGRRPRRCAGAADPRPPPATARHAAFGKAPYERHPRAPDRPPIDAAFLTRWLDTAATALDREAAHLTELDSPIGDADHGSNMRRGFIAARTARRAGAAGHARRRAGRGRDGS